MKKRVAKKLLKDVLAGFGPNRHSTWQRMIRRLGCDAVVRAITPSNAELLKWAEESPPPQHWYDETPKLPAEAGTVSEVAIT